MRNAACVRHLWRAGGWRGSARAFNITASGGLSGSDCVGCWIGVGMERCVRWAMRVRRARSRRCRPVRVGARTARAGSASERARVMRAAATRAPRGRARAPGRRRRSASARARVGTTTTTDAAGWLLWELFFQARAVARCVASYRIQRTTDVTAGMPISCAQVERARAPDAERSAVAPCAETRCRAGARPSEPECRSAGSAVSAPAPRVRAAPPERAGARRRARARAGTRR